MTTKHPGLYADLGKKTNDLLTKEFPDRHKLEVKTKTNSGVSFDGSITRNLDGSFYGSLNPKYKLSGHGITLGATVDTKRALKVEVTSEDLVPGLKASVTGHADSESLTVDTEYKHEYITVGGSLNVLSPKGNRLTASTVVGYEGLALGLQAEYVYDKWQNINGVASYTRPDSISTLFARVNTQAATNIIGITHHHRLTNRASIAGEATLDVTKTSESPKITIGGTYDFLESPTTVKGKLDTEGRFALSYAHRLNKYTRLILGTSVNTNNFSPSGNHTFGLTLAIND
jgi:voltage-dependent anion channel protein 2